MVDFNINNHICVQLTQAGKKELERQHNELAKQLPILDVWEPPKEDADGWSEWQAHTLLSQLGHMLYLGGELPFNPNIKIQI